MVRIITAMQGTQEEPQLLWTRKVKGVNSWLRIGVCVGGLSDFKAQFGSMMCFMLGVSRGKQSALRGLS